MVETPATKAIINGTVFPDGSAIGVQVRKNGEDFYQAGTSTNVEYTYASAGSTWSTTTSFYLTNTLGEVYAYYPYDAGMSNTAAFSTIPVIIDASAITGSETDYMYATPLTGANSVSKENNNASLVMNHAFAQVSFYVYKINYSGTGTFTQFQIEDAAATSFVKTSSVALTMDITNGTLDGGEKGTLTRTLATSVVLPDVAPAPNILDLKEQVNATTLVVPTGTFAIGDIQFTFTVDGETYTATNTTEISWLKGYQYIYTAKLEGTGLVIVSATITDWTAESGGLIDIE